MELLEISQSAWEVRDRGAVEQNSVKIKTLVVKDTTCVVFRGKQQLNILLSNDKKMLQNAEFLGLVSLPHGYHE